MAFQLRPYNHGLFYQWLETAMNDDSVWPFLTRWRTQTYSIDVSDEWNQVHYMSNSQNAIASFYFNHKDDSASMNIFGLKSYGEDRKYDILELLRFIFVTENVFQKFNFKFIDFMVHETNEVALKFFQKRFRHWGVKPAGAYDKKLRQFVDSYNFRISEEDISKFYK